MANDAATSAANPAYVPLIPKDTSVANSFAVLIRVFLTVPSYPSTLSGSTL